jgi:hypothetical protein
VAARSTRVAGGVRRGSLRVRAEAKDLTFDMSARIKIQRGIDQLADAVSVTLGPRGAWCKLLKYDSVSKRSRQPRALESDGCACRFLPAAFPL